MYIEKYPEVPHLTDKQIQEITEAVFCEDVPKRSCDAVFIFGSSHPSTYQNAFELYKEGFVKNIIITGGLSKSKDKHKDWVYGDKTEADLMFDKLKDMGVPESHMFVESKSTNSKENVVFAKDIFDFSGIKSLYFISKNYAAGRQYRTLKKYVDDVDIISCPYQVELEGQISFDRFNWMKYKTSRSLVFGEYLRIIYYGKKGDIYKLNSMAQGLEGYIKAVLKFT